MLRKEARPGRTDRGQRCSREAGGPGAPGIKQAQVLTCPLLGSARGTDTGPREAEPCTRVPALCSATAHSLDLGINQGPQADGRGVRQHQELQGIKDRASPSRGQLPQLRQTAVKPGKETAQYQTGRQERAASEEQREEGPGRRRELGRQPEPDDPTGRFPAREAEIWEVARLEEARTQRKGFQSAPFPTKGFGHLNRGRVRCRQVLGGEGLRTLLPGGPASSETHEERLAGASCAAVGGHLTSASLSFITSRVLWFGY